MNEFKTVIPIPVFNYKIFVIFTDDLIKSADKLAEQGKIARLHGIDDTSDGFHVPLNNQSYSYIVLKYDATINHITHETYHAVSTMFRWISAKHEEEITAYFLGYLVSLLITDQEKAKKALDKQNKVC